LFSFWLNLKAKIIDFGLNKATHGIIFNFFAFCPVVLRVKFRQKIILICQNCTCWQACGSKKRVPVLSFNIRGDLATLVSESTPYLINAGKAINYTGASISTRTDEPKLF
jgi:hypothetical protein